MDQPGRTGEAQVSAADGAEGADVAPTTPAPAAAATAAGASAEAATDFSSRRRGAVPLWLWPALATIAVAASGQLLGAWWAAVLIILMVTVSMAALLGTRAGRPRSWASAIAVIAAALAVGALFFYRDAIETLTTHAPDSPATSTPTVAATLRLGPGADLRGADLSKRPMARLDLRGADLSGANLSGTDLSGALLDGAILRGTDLHDACLRRARLNGVTLNGADFAGADIRDMVTNVPRSDLPASWPPVPSVLVTCRN